MDDLDIELALIEPDRVDVESLLPPLARRAVNPLDDELKTMADAQLIALAKPNPVDWELKLRLWRKIFEVEGNPREVAQHELYQGICRSNVYTARMQNKYTSAFIGRPPNEFEGSNDGLLTAVTTRLFEIMTLPVQDINGRVDHKTANLLVNVSKMLLDRKYGTAVQRSLTASTGSPNRPIPTTPAMMDAEIRKLEAALGPKEKARLPSGSTPAQDDEGLITVSSKPGSDRV